MTIKKLNSTGTLWTNGQDYFSYRQQMTVNYKGYHLYDSGFYSRTTNKHQSKIRMLTNKKYDLRAIDLYCADFNKGVDWSIRNEIEYLEDNKAQLETKRNTKKKLETIDKIDKKIIFLTKLLNK